MLNYYLLETFVCLQFNSGSLTTQQSAVSCKGLADEATVIKPCLVSSLACCLIAQIKQQPLIWTPEAIFFDRYTSGLG